MPDYNTDIPESPDVEKPQPEQSDEQKKQKVEKKLAEPAVFEFAKAKAEKEGKEVAEFLEDSDDEAIEEMIKEYEEKVEPAVKAYGDFLNKEFLNNLAIIDSKVRKDAKEKAEVFLVRLYLDDEAKFVQYQELMEKHDDLNNQIEELDTQLKNDYKSNDVSRLEADKQYLENRVSAGQVVAGENKADFDAETARIRSITIFSREGWNNRISAFKNIFRLRGYRSDAEINETEHYDEARDTLAEKIKEIEEKQKAMGVGIEQKNNLLKEIGGVKEELLESMNVAGEVRSILLKGLMDATKGGSTFDAYDLGKTVGAMDKIWNETDRDGTQDYDDFRNQISKKLEESLLQLLGEQTKAVGESINSTSLQKFGQFVDNSIKTQEAKDIVEKELRLAIDTEPDITKKPHLAMMMRRVKSKEF